MVTLDLFRNEDRFEEFRKGQTIFREGDHGAMLYVVLAGNVQLTVKGKEVENLGPGGVLGEMSLIDTAPRSATATASSDCKLVPVDLKRFTFLVQQTPHFSLQIMRVIADRLRRMDQKL